MMSGITELILISFLIITPFLFLLYKRPEGTNRFGEAVSSAGLSNSIKKFFYNYFNFSGRASRSEFWYAMLFCFLVVFIPDFLNLFGVLMFPDILTSILFLGIAIPMLSVSARRLHDTNRSGWLQLASGFLPVGIIIALFWYCEPSRD